MSTPLSFGTWLKQQRRILDLTQEELAQRIACSLSTLRKLEREELLPSKELARVIAESFTIPEAQREEFIAFARGARTMLLSPSPAPSIPSPAPTPTSVPPAAASPAPQYRLPLPLTPLIGRQWEILTGQQLLQQPGVRLLTLSGPPGTGKTRLALALAEAVRQQFADGVCFVALAAVNDPALVIDAVARTLNLAANPKLDPLTQLQEFLADKELLLVLDNFEQVVNAAELLVELLQSAPHLKLAVTSRTLLSIYGEHEFPVSPLTLPDPQRLPSLDELALYPAVALFVQRAQAVLPTFRLNDANAVSVVQICQRLDGLPLAIEMAAARCKLYPPHVILEQLRERLSTLGSTLRNLSPRQQTLHNAIEWSYNLLTPEEQATLNRLSVFVDGFTKQAASAILDRVDAEMELWALVEKSLLRTEQAAWDESRFAMLETIRAFGKEKLAASPAWQETLQRHAIYYHDLAQQALPFLMGSPRQMEWLQRLEAEQNHFRAALAWAITQRAVTLAMELADSLFVFWSMRGYFQEGQRWLETVAVLSEEESVLQSRILNRIGTFAWHRGDLGYAQQMQQRALVMQEKIGDQAGISRSLQNLAIIAGMQGEYTTSAQLLQRCLAIERSLNNQNAIKVVIQNLALATERQGDYAQAEALFRESLAIRTQQKDRVGMAHVWNGLGNLLRKQGRLADAHSAMLQSLEIRRDTGNQREIALSLMALAHLMAAMGETVRSLRFYAAAQRIQEELKLTISADARQADDRLIEQLRMQLGGALDGEWQAAYALSTAVVMDEALSRSLP